MKNLVIMIACIASNWSNFICAFEAETKYRLIIDLPSLVIEERGGDTENRRACMNADQTRAIYPKVSIPQGYERYEAAVWDLNRYLEQDVLLMDSKRRSFTGKIRSKHNNAFKLTIEFPEDRQSTSLSFNLELNPLNSNATSQTYICHDDNDAYLGVIGVIKEELGSQSRCSSLAIKAAKRFVTKFF